MAEVVEGQLLTTGQLNVRLTAENASVEGVTAAAAAVLEREVVITNAKGVRILDCQGTRGEKAYFL